MASLPLPQTPKKRRSVPMQGLTVAAKNCKKAPALAIYATTTAVSLPFSVIVKKHKKRNDVTLMNQRLSDDAESEYLPEQVVVAVTPQQLPCVREPPELEKIISKTASDDAPHSEAAREFKEYLSKGIQ